MTIFRSRFSTFLAALIAGLALSVVVGAVAASRHSSEAARPRAFEHARSLAARPDASVMTAFRRPAAAADRLPPSAVDVVESFNNAPGVSSDLLAGRPQIANARRILGGVGPTANWSLYAVPTDKHLLCAAWVGAIAGSGCFQGFAPGTPALIGQSQSGSVRYVWGFLRENVKGVSVVMNGTESAATMGNSGFYFQVPANATVDGIVLKLADATSQRLGLAAAPHLSDG